MPHMAKLQMLTFKCQCMCGILVWVCACVCRQCLHPLTPTRIMAYPHTFAILHWHLNSPRHIAPQRTAPHGSVQCIARTQWATYDIFAVFVLLAGFGNAVPPPVGAGSLARWPRTTPEHSTVAPHRKLSFNCWEEQAETSWKKRKNICRWLLFTLLRLCLDMGMKKHGWMVNGERMEEWACELIVMLTATATAAATATATSTATMRVCLLSGYVMRANVCSSSTLPPPLLHRPGRAAVPIGIPQMAFQLPRPVNAHQRRSADKA